MVRKAKADRQAQIRIESDKKKERYSGAKRQTGTSRAVQGMNKITKNKQYVIASFIRVFSTVC
jgi:hypothetical protein